MRQRRSGHINIISEAGKQAKREIGSRYVMSKFGVAGLTQSINAEARMHGIGPAILQATLTLLPTKTGPPSAEARQKLCRR